MRKLFLALLLGGLAATVITAETIIPGGYVSGTWEASGSPYLVEGWITVHDDSSLIIESGVEVIFQGYYRFIINGYFEAIGTESDSILFTAADTSEGWWGLRFNEAQDSCQIAYSIVERGYPFSDGGGIYCQETDILIIGNCTVRNNSPHGINCVFSNPIINQCLVYNNWGKGLNFAGCDTILISECTICQNGPSFAIDLNNYSYATIENSIIEDNEYAGIHVQQSEINISNCDILRNGHFGIFSSDSYMMVTDCIISDNVSTGIQLCGGSGEYISRCIVSNNGYGGISKDPGSLSFLINCTISGNYGWGIGLHSASQHIRNSIIEGTEIGTGIYFDDSPASSVKYCDLYDNDGGSFGGSPPPELGIITTINNNGDSCDVFKNIFLDPLFYSTAGDSAFHLTENSPCIDAGDPSSLPDPDGTITDMGAIYFDQSGSGVHVEGYCYLQNQTNHQFTKVLFIADSPSAQTDSTFTYNTGYYNLYLTPGFYDVYYMHDGYITGVLLDQNCTGSISLPEITLVPEVPMYNIGGQLSGVLEEAIYFVEDDISVMAGDSLIIEPGAVFRFTGDFGFNIDGYLYAAGTESDSIKFISDNWLMPWNGIDLNSSSGDTCKFEYCLVSGSDEHGIYIISGSPSLSNSTIKNNWAYSMGGGLYCGNDSDPTVTNCTINGNFSTGYGAGIYCGEGCSASFLDCDINDNQGSGGVYIDHCAPSFENCTINENLFGLLMSDFAAPVFINCQINYNSGGGMRLLWDCTPSFYDCDILYNTAGEGGGINVRWRCNAYFERCIVSENTADEGGGIYCFDSSPTFIKCSINRNTANYGGGIKICQDAYQDSTHPYFEDCEFIENTANVWGGGIRCGLVAGYPSISTFRRCVLAGNSPETFQGSWNIIEMDNCTITDSYDDNLYLGEGMQLYATNSIFSFATTGVGIAFVSSYSSYISYCNFYGNAAGSFSGAAPPNLGQLVSVNANGDSCDIYNNIFLDPLYLYREQNDYRLQWGSPCIDAGDPDPQYNDPDGTVADMGAFYFNQNEPVQVFLTPYNAPIIVPPEGGSFDYGIQVVNISGQTHQLDVWLNVLLPDGSLLGPLVGPVPLAMPPGFNGFRERTQAVPAGAPAGTYTYQAWVGIHPVEPWHHDSFIFSKLGSDGSDAFSGWSNHGDPFENWLTSEELVIIPSSYSLDQNYPNPFNPFTVINFQLPEACFVELVIYDISGRMVAELADGWRDAGYHEVSFDASGLSSGVYIYWLKAGAYSANGKMILMK